MVRVFLFCVALVFIVTEATRVQAESKSRSREQVRLPPVPPVPPDTQGRRTPVATAAAPAVPAAAKTPAEVVRLRSGAILSAVTLADIG